MILYTDAATVAASLNLNAEANLSDPISIGATTLPFNTLNGNAVLPSSWAPGMYLALDYFNPNKREIVQITGAPTVNSVPITATLNAHVSGSPVVECSGINDWIAAATKAVDDVCYIPKGFGQETITETIKGYIDNEGWLIVPCSKPEPQVNTITSLSYLPSPADQQVSLSIPPQAWLEDTYLLRVGNIPTSSVYRREVMVTITYTGGYNPIPDDIQRATIAIAARFYKEKDSGFSDAIGNSDLGILTYKKAIPADIKMMLKRYVRYV